jgi:hypothetical protein
VLLIGLGGGVDYALFVILDIAGACRQARELNPRLSWP